jgi:hypothetical protein
VLDVQPLPPGRSLSRAWLADVDGDRICDLLAVFTEADDEFGGLWWARGDAIGPPFIFGGWASLEANPFMSRLTDAAAADLDGDGRTDLLLVTASAVGRRPDGSWWVRPRVSDQALGRST